jgi:hypothetical protein
MKKVLFSAMIAVASLGYSNNASAISVFNDEVNPPVGFSKSEATATKVHVKVSVKWGMLWGCAAPGMCSVDVDVTVETNMVHNPGPTGTGGTITINAYKAEIDPAKMPLFGAPEFKFAGEFKIPDPVCKELGIPLGSRIPMGDYPLFDDGEFFRIEVGQWL